MEHVGATLLQVPEERHVVVVAPLLRVKPTLQENVDTEPVVPVGGDTAPLEGTGALTLHATGMHVGVGWLHPPLARHTVVVLPERA